MKKISKVIVIVLVLVICSFILFKVIVKNSSSEKIIGGFLPEDMSNYNISIWDYNALHDYYYTMNGTTELYEQKDFKFVKIINNKLSWNIDNDWIMDKNLNDNVKQISPSSNSCLVLTTDNKLYKISYNLEEKLEMLSENDYEMFDYVEIGNNRQVEDLKAKTFCECECWNVHYIKFYDDNALYTIDENDKLVDINTIYSLKNISYLDNSCNQFSEVLNIDENGIINIEDSNRNDIVVKYYINLSKLEGNGNIYNLVIDNYNNLYLSINGDKLNNIAKVKNIDKSVNQYKERLKIVLETDEILNFSE